MLILSRKENEMVIIGNNIQVIVLGENIDGVILGFIAPPNVSIHRGEVYLKNQISSFHQNKKQSRNNDSSNSKKETIK